MNEFQIPGLPNVVRRGDLVEQRQPVPSYRHEQSEEEQLGDTVRPVPHHPVVGERAEDERDGPGQEPERPTVELLQGMLDRQDGERVAAVRKALQETMDRNAQVFRTEASLKQALTDIQGLKERYRTVSVQDKGKRFNTDLLEAVELGFLLDLAEVIVVGALERKESRGGHFREDYPNRDDVNYRRHTMAYRDQATEGPQVRLDYKPVVQTRYEPMERKY